MFKQITLKGGAIVNIDTGKIDKCDGCGDLIFWGVTKNEKRIPLKQDETTGEFFAHFADCPFADEFRKKGGTNAKKKSENHETREA